MLSNTNTKNIQIGSVVCMGVGADKKYCRVVAVEPHTDTTYKVKPLAGRYGKKLRTPFSKRKSYEVPQADLRVGFEIEKELAADLDELERRKRNLEEILTEIEDDEEVF